MKTLHYTLLVLLFICTKYYSSAQNGSILGIISIDGKLAPFAQVSIDSGKIGASTNINGKFALHKIPYGIYTLTASYVGYKRVTKELNLNQEILNIDINLNEPSLELEEIVVTGTKTFKRQTNTPIIVNVLSSETMENVQACNLSEGLRFQAGLRVETDCQTCNYTQLRMNGLAGGYSQILINGRPIFSPLTGLYGLEQIPSNMLDRIEVIKGGGSSLYGSSAIGGTVNVITKKPRNNSYSVNYNYQNIGMQASDNTLNANISLLSKNKNAGVSLFANRRQRDFYDENGDNFSELSFLKNTNLGSSLFFTPNENQKVELNFSYLNEYRFGGEMLYELIPHKAQQSEERTHNVLMSSVDYEIDFSNKTSLISYAAWQHTDRAHYTGILPDSGTLEHSNFLSNLPYGESTMSTFNTGTQLNHRLDKFITGINLLTIGTEYITDNVYDEIDAYQYLIEQKSQNFGVFLQSDWEINPVLSLLSGVRLDQHNLLKNAILNPRSSLLFKPTKNTQLRVNYGTGFRAPQAFDTDLHIAFAGGGISRVSLSPDLKPERSESISASINYDKPMQKWIAGFTIEGFYTRLKDAFILDPIGQDQFGEMFLKTNGAGATVQGLTLDIRANYDRKVQLESGFTLQKSAFDQSVEYIDGLDEISAFVRTPNDYAYALLEIKPNNKLKAALNYLYTGSMIVPHFSGAPNQVKDEIVETKPFSELSIKLAYSPSISLKGSKFEINTGVKNLFNAYQNDFDIGKNRDSNYIYGPAQPRSFYIGLKLYSAK